MANDICLECGASMPQGEHHQCPECSGEHLIPADKLNPEDLTEEQKQVIVAQHEKELAELAEKELAAKHAEHPINADGELDMTSPKNNPILQKPKPEKGDMTDPANNPLLPDSTAKKDFGKEEKEVDMTKPENNPLIPK